MHPTLRASQPPLVDESYRLILAALEGTAVALQHPGKAPHRRSDEFDWHTPGEWRRCVKNTASRLALLAHTHTCVFTVKVEAM